MSRFDNVIKVTLLCGCTVGLRAKPLNPTSSFMCRSGRGHSYNQSWTSYEDNGSVFRNPALAPMGM